MSLQTPDEVRAYMQEYVGTSEKANNFAAEFLRQREFNMLEQTTGKAGKKPASAIPKHQRAAKRPP